MKQTRPRFTVLEWTNHYRIIDGRTYRDAIARRNDGELRIVAYPEDVAA